MRHAWIIDVLTDLQTYADNNDLPDIATAARQTLDIAVAEIAKAPLHAADEMLD